MGISYYRALSAYGEPDLVAGLFQASGSPLAQCKIGLAFGSPICSMPNALAPVKFAGLNTASLFFGVACHVVEAASNECGAQGSIHGAQADLYSAKVTLSETVLPTLGQPSGALWAGGVVSGVVPVGFNASDPSGIAQDLVRTETGQTVIFASQSCDFTSSTPCPQLPNAINLSWANPAGHPSPVAGTLVAVNAGSVKVSWRSRSLGIKRGSGSRTVQIRAHKLQATTFTLSHRARTGAVHIVVRDGVHFRASALARPS